VNTASFSTPFVSSQTSVSSGAVVNTLFASAPFGSSQTSVSPGAAVNTSSFSTTFDARITPQHFSSRPKNSHPRQYDKPRYSLGYIVTAVDRTVEQLTRVVDRLEQRLLSPYSEIYCPHCTMYTEPQPCSHSYFA
jgi:hypothetical protein